MNRKRRRMTSREKFYRAKKMLATSHILIAVVALIECFLLITFTTYSWIESASSLVIKNGINSNSAVIHTTSTGVTYLDITSTLNSTLQLENAAPGAEQYADLEKFFSVVDQYRMAKATSPDGINFFFPMRNNTNTSATTFRRGDTTDYNTSYNYFDFAVQNNYRGRDFFFDNTGEFAELFTVNDTDKNNDPISVTEADDTVRSFRNEFTYDADNNPATTGDRTPMTYKDAVKSAMRLSVTYVIDGVSNTGIYSVYGDSYNSMNMDSGVYNNTNLNRSVTTRRIADYTVGGTPVFSVPNKDEGGGHSMTYVSIRVWFEVLDPRFQQAFGFSAGSFTDSALFRAVPALDIGINFQFVNDINTFNQVFFDDYTYSNAVGNVGGHVTDDYSGSAGNYIMYIKVKNPEYEYDNTLDQYLYYPMSKEAYTGYNRWSCGTIIKNIIEYIKEGTNYSQIQFCYGNFDASSDPPVPAEMNPVIYSWTPSSAPATTGLAHYYTAYSITPVGSAGNYSGIGSWDLSVKKITFKDYTTAVTTTFYNEGANNHQFMKGNATDTVYLSSSVNAYSAASTTATMFYNSTEKTFEAYIPSTWVDQSSDTLYFTYASAGYLTANSPCIVWTAPLSSDLVTSISGGTVPEYSAVGYGGDYVPTQYASSSGTLTGVGTFGDVRMIVFSTELIEGEAAAQPTYRYFAGVEGVGGTSADTVTYYVMNPYNSYQKYFTWVPEELIDTEPMYFRSYSAPSSDSANINGEWYAPSPAETDSVYYAVEMMNTADSSTNYSSLDPGTDARGYWHVAVLADGTYENLIYETLFGNDAVSGAKLEYCTSTDNGVSYGSYVTVSSYNGSANTDYNRLDQYRWYALLNADDTHIRWRWTPYDGTDSYIATQFVYTQTLVDGMYYVITEAPDNTPSQEP